MLLKFLVLYINIIIITSAQMGLLKNNTLVYVRLVIGRNSSFIWFHLKLLQAKKVGATLTHDLDLDLEMVGGDAHESNI